MLVSTVIQAPLIFGLIFRVNRNEQGEQQMLMDFGFAGLRVPVLSEAARDDDAFVGVSVPVHHVPPRLQDALAPQPPHEARPSGQRRPEPQGWTHLQQPPLHLHHLWEGNGVKTSTCSLFIASGAISARDCTSRSETEVHP